jgi:protein SCO1/2
MRARLFPTLLACALASAGTGAALAELTGGFEHWTFEERRRAHALQGRLVAPMLARADAPAREVRILDFIYTRCPTVCRVLGTEYQQMQQAILQTPDSAVRLVSISFDVERDSEADLRAYAKTHQAQAPVWTVTAPATREDDQRLRRALGVVAIPDGMGGFVHNSALHLIDRDGRVLALYDYTQWRKALSHAQRLGQRSAP